MAAGDGTLATASPTIRVQEAQQAVTTVTTVTAATWIDAPPAAVWAVLTDLRRYPEWNPLFPAAAGDLAVGQRITLRSTPGGGHPVTIHPRVTAVVPEAELRWAGRLPGLICGEHRFTLKPGNGGTLVLQSEAFRGFMVRFSDRALERAETGFQALNGALKARVETSRGAGDPAAVTPRRPAPDGGFRH